ncbi:MAG: (2Fe-2S) ferredoxin domain-containing protein [Methylococcales bacterium]|nr:(2Fe-2S) ferredoxin domain-containing protein [Methylococcales bacterium]MDD5755033.1 (2Fe-2S) ferredoxin domain-containing protein [Methylococcales bacterium]
MPKTTLFVCTHRRNSADYPSCGVRGSETLLQQLKLATKNCNFNVEPNICFGHCEEGAVVKITPNGKFYHHVTELDIPTLIADANFLSTTALSPNTAPSVVDCDCPDSD